MLLKDRLVKLVEYEGLNPNQFYIQTGLANGFLNTVGESLRKPSIEKLKKTFPHWNIDWLLSGEGDMIKPISPTGQTNIGSGLLVGHGNRNLNISSGVNIQTLEEWKLREATLLSQIESLKKEVQHLNDLLSSKNEIIELLKSK